MSRPVTPCRPVSTAGILVAADPGSFSARCFSRGAFCGQVPPVPGGQPGDPELRGDCEAGGDGAALQARRQPAGISRVPPRAAGQVPGLPGTGQHAVTPPGLQPAGRPLPVVPGRLGHRRGYLPAAQPVRQRQRLPPGGAEAAGLARPPRRVLIGGHPDRRHHLRLADVDAAHPVPAGGSPVTSSTRPSPPPSSHLPACEVVPPGEPGRAEESDPRARRDNERPLE